jgi:two-component system response regulator AtoC
VTKTHAPILVADDDPVARDLLVEVLHGEGHETVAAGSAADSIRLAQSTPLQLALIDLRMPDGDGLQVLKELKALQPSVPVIIVTAFADMETAVAAIRAGAHDYLSKPFGMDEIRNTVRRTLKANRPSGGTKRASEKAATGTEALVGKSAAMVAVYKLVARVATNDATVLITGETGTGKEQVARAIHAASARAKEPFVAVDCTALPETLFESELFGHERGAFTGAHAQRQGMLETAGAGTCFLDEIGELSPALQAKLLRTLQEKSIRRVGSNQTVALRARIIAATNRDLARLVRQHEFREDLLYRLDVVRINIPPLRERREDIPLLIQHFANKYAGEVAAPEVAPDAMALLCHYDWPGNVRQLENVVHRALAVGASATILLEDVPAEMRQPGPAQAPAPAPAMSLRQLKRRHVLEVLERVGGNKLRAAQLLGIDRRTLYRILERSDIADDEAK